MPAYNGWKKHMGLEWEGGLLLGGTSELRKPTMKLHLLWCIVLRLHGKPES